MNKGIVTRSAVIRALTPEQIENRQAEFVISTESPDTYGTVFRIDGWNLDRYKNNPIVCYNHKFDSSNPDDVIGTSELRIEDNQLIAVVTFESEEDNPLAEKVFRKVQNGTLRMASINANIHEARWGNFDDGENPDYLYFTNQELLEWSIVSVGSNPDALKRNTDFINEFKKPEQSETDIKKRSLAVTEAEVELKLKMFK